MSMTREDYIILGFDLSPYREQIYTDGWRTDENIDKWEYCQTKDNIQLFTDPMSGAHLYFGYILSAPLQKYCRYIPDYQPERLSDLFYQRGD